MDFSIRPGQAVDGEVARVMDEQFDAALRRLSGVDDGDDLAVAVHEARKSCKRLRAVFRLVRQSISSHRFRTLNACVRDAARELSSTRDAQALVDMYDDLLEAQGVVDSDGDFAVVRIGLADRVAATEMADAGNMAPVLRARERLELARDVAARTHLDEGGFRALRGGLAGTYGQGRKTLFRFRAHPSPELSHDWRKSVKYTWHHVELLENAAPSVLTPYAARFHDLSGALGDAHNLTVLMELLDIEPARFGGARATSATVEMARAARSDLEERAVRLGLRLYAEKPEAFTERLQSYWQAGEMAGSELPTGELANIAGKPGATSATARSALLTPPDRHLSTA